MGYAECLGTVSRDDQAPVVFDMVNLSGDQATIHHVGPHEQSDSAKSWFSIGSWSDGKPA